MDPETIQQIATEVARHLPTYPWTLLFVQIGLTLLAAAVGAFFGEYLRTRGRNLATKADFEGLKDQLRDNTELVETIKSVIGQRDWTKREYTNERRKKLEALITVMHDCEAYVEQHRYKSMQGEFFGERDRLNELQSIADLYLPELRSEVSDFTTACRKEIARSATLGVGIATADMHGDLNARQKLFDDYRAQTNPTNLFKASDALVAAGHELLLKIMDVDERNDDSREPRPRTDLTVR